MADQSNTEGADDFELGDVLRADASLQYRLWPRALGRRVPGFFYGVLEANLMRADRNEANAVADPNPGGTTLFLEISVRNQALGGRGRGARAGASGSRRGRSRG
ncbi:MAG: hypothetical protein GWN84_06615 [Gammaproteobacteria bacterium]|nr:hypothetical protein [Gammaproteobacteria bacterium]NIR82583.1 hypothetical protein [Gammaproteobacteria bacterium]NIR88786.1 hypothetical protein [Gammaproteobacteria bacterium]NIV73991.1 hypothetical protein [Gammaproteobacteria bacterium]